MAEHPLGRVEDSSLRLKHYVLLYGPMPQRLVVTLLLPLFIFFWHNPFDWPAENVLEVDGRSFELSGRYSSKVHFVRYFSVKERVTCLFLQSKHFNTCIFGNHSNNSVPRIMLCEREILFC